MGWGNLQISWSSSLKLSDPASKRATIIQCRWTLWGHQKVYHLSKHVCRTVRNGALGLPLISTPVIPTSEKYGVKWHLFAYITDYNNKIPTWRGTYIVHYIIIIKEYSSQELPYIVDKNLYKLQKNMDKDHKRSLISWTKVIPSENYGENSQGLAYIVYVSHGHGDGVGERPGLWGWRHTLLLLPAWPCRRKRLIRVIRTRHYNHHHQHHVYRQASYQKAMSGRQEQLTTK